MPRFLAVYMGSPDGPQRAQWNALSDEERGKREAAGMQAWMDWGAKHAAHIVDNGGPLGKTKRVSNSGVEDAVNMLAGYVIVDAPSHEAAAQMFENHPHFAIFPGAGVEIMTCPPIPGS